MLEWHSEYQETGKITSDMDEQEETPTNEIDPPDEADNQSDEPAESSTNETPPNDNGANHEQGETFNHRSPSAHTAVPGLPT